ncbi:hypothetical protein SAMN05192550_1836 [Flavobacterium glycines]|uniref:Uncharacterized protein n=1 Tax=Flavobacterium glycines TaxID=551990 RepID=A0A1G8SJM0_9FLAO|nr:hypothetical protein SAMN05192550_1836 [Flavobacterium glycines]
MCFSVGLDKYPLLFINFSTSLSYWKALFVLLAISPYLKSNLSTGLQFTISSFTSEPK